MMMNNTVLLCFHGQEVMHELCGCGSVPTCLILIRLSNISKVYMRIFAILFLNNAKRAKRKRKEKYKLGCAAGCLLPCLRYRLHNLVPVVWHRQMNWIPVCLGLQAKLKELSRQSCSVLRDTFYLDYVPMCVCCFKSSGSVTLRPCFKPCFLCIIYFVISAYGVKIVQP